MGVDELFEREFPRLVRALGVAPGTTKSNLHDARRRLRARLEEQPRA